MPNINITVAGKIATNMSPGVAIVCGNSDYTATFTFDSEWDGKQGRTARFVYIKDGRSVYQDVEFTGNTVAVPVFAGIDYVLVGVFAGDLQTTTPAKVLCNRSILCMAQNEALTVLGKEQLQGIIAATKADAQKAAASEQAAEESATAAEESAGAAAESQAHAAQYAAASAAALESMHGLAGEDAPTIVCNASGEIITVADASNRVLRGLTLYGKTTQNGTPSPEAPVALASAGTTYKRIKTYVSKGKNLFGGEALADVLVEKANATKDTAAGTVKYQANIVTSKVLFNAFKKETRYTIILYGYNTSSSGSKATNLRVWYTDGSNDNLLFATASELSYCVFTTDNNKTVSSVSGANNSAYAILHYDKCGIFEGVLTEADFAPYEGQTLSVSTPDGLCGIPVSSGGNYTDANGQQWVSDRVDFESGKYFQKVGSVVLDGSADEVWTLNDYGVFSCQTVAKNYNRKTKPLCSHYPTMVTSRSPEIPDKTLAMYNQSSGSIYNLWIHDSSYTTVEELVSALAANPVTVQYVIKTEVETALTAEELVQYAALHTYKPNTTVYNDSGAGMALEYVADTKLYIDNKFNELAAAVVNNA